MEIPMKKPKKKKLYYLDAETTGLNPNLRLTSFSTEIDELIEDYLRWVNENKIDLDHTSYSDIRVAKTGLLVATLEQSDDFMSVLEHPVAYTLLELAKHFIFRFAD